MLVLEQSGDIINLRALYQYGWMGDYRYKKSLEWPTWPLPNVILMTSAENQPTLEKRVPKLLQIPAAKRVVSYEPALGEIDFKLDLFERETGYMHSEDCPNYCDYACGGESFDGGVDGIICGAETGPGARPMALDWARSVRDQCKAAGVPFFFKRDSAGNRQLDGRKWEEVPW